MQPAAVDYTGTWSDDKRAASSVVRRCVRHESVRTIRLHFSGASEFFAVQEALVAGERKN